MRPCGLRVGLILLALITALPAAAATTPKALPVAGRLERALIVPGNLILEAKLDTGARTSSLHAAHIERHLRDGVEWARFEITGDNGQPVRMERPVVRIATVKSALGKDEGRPVVALGICIGKVYRITEVNLVDRSDLTSPLLIGRRFLQGRFLVNVNRRYLLEPVCTHTELP